MPVPQQFADRYTAMCEDVAAKEELPVEQLQWRMEHWPASVCVFVLLRWESAGYEGFAGAHRLLDLLKNLGATITGLSWLARQTYVGVRGRRDGDREFDLILPVSTLTQDRADLARVLKAKLTVDKKTRAISMVKPGAVRVEPRQRGRMPKTEHYRREADHQDEPEPPAGGKPK